MERRPAWFIADARVVAALWPGNSACIINQVAGAVILQSAGQWPGFAQFWRDWDWPTIARTIDNLAGLGLNCVQVTATGLDDGGVTHPDIATMRERVGQLASYATACRMVLNPQLGYQPSHSFAAGLSVGTSAAVQMARVFAEHANIGFIDAMNEVNGYPAPGWMSLGAEMADMQRFVRAIRVVVGAIPVTVSVSCSTVSDVASSWMQAMVSLCDFHNVHTYFFQNGGPAAPVVADFTALRAASWYLGRFIVGETGMPSSYTPQRRAAWLLGNGVVGAEADCLGSILWGATDTTAATGRSENVSGFGLLEVTGTMLRSALADPIRSWPGAL